MEFRRRRPRPLSPPSAAPTHTPPQEEQQLTSCPPACPVVLVGGFLLPPTPEFDQIYWGEALSCGGKSRVIIPVHPSPIASLHDRVCQIFFELKGGQVTYGKDHAEHYGHDCLGQKHDQGLYPEWDALHPLHLVGHSFGGVTVRLLLHYLANSMFEGLNTSADWVVSVTSLNAPHNGTRLVYGLGADPETPPLVHYGSVGHMLTALAHVVEYLDLTALKRVGMDFGLGYWGWSRKRGLWTGAMRIMEVVLGYSSLGTLPDNAAYDMTIHAAKEYNAAMTTQDGVFYYSFVGTLPAHNCSSGRGKVASLFKGLAYRLMGWHVTSARCHEQAICQDFPPLDDWCKAGESDGIVSVFSQAFPRLPVEAPHQDGLPQDLAELRPGLWYVTTCPVDHVGIVGFPSSQEFQATFFLSLYEIFTASEAARMTGTIINSTRQYPWSSVMAALDTGSSNSQDEETKDPLEFPPAVATTMRPSSSSSSSSVLSPSNKGPSSPPQQQPSSSSPSSSPALLTGLLLVTWLVSLSLMLYAKPLFLASLATSLLCLLLSRLACLLLAPAFLCPRGKTLWSLHLVGLAHAIISSLISGLLLLTDALLSHGTSDQPVIRLLIHQPNVDRLMTAQLLLSCGYFLFNLFSQLRQQLVQQQAKPLAYQALLLTLYTITLHRDLHLRPSTTTSGLLSGGGAATDASLVVVFFLRPVLLLTILSETQTAFLLLRDMLLLTGSRFPRSQSDRVLLVASQEIQQQQPPASSRLLTPVWVGLWITFLACQVFPLFFLLLAFFSRFLVLEALFLLPSAAGAVSSRWLSITAAAALAAGLTLCFNVGKIKQLSRSFQHDRWTLHLARRPTEMRRTRGMEDGRSMVPAPVSAT